MSCEAGVRWLFATVVAKIYGENGADQPAGRQGDSRTEWIWMTANRFGDVPVRLQLLRGGLVRWNGGTPHGLWSYYAEDDVLFVRVHYDACEWKAKDHMFRSVPGSEARAHAGQDSRFNVILLPASACGGTRAGARALDEPTTMSSGARRVSRLESSRDT